MMAEVDYVLEEFDRRLTADGSGLELTLQDTTAPALQVNAPRAHKSVRVTAPASSNTLQYRDQGLARVEDEIQVELLYTAVPTGQRARERECIRHAAKVRAWLTDGIWLRTFRPTWLRETRGPVPGDAQLYQITQTYRVTRDARLGG